jgi:hypothetical protein
MKGPTLLVFLTATCLFAHAADTTSPVFIKATQCDRPLSSRVLASLKRWVVEKYRLTSRLDDEGKLDLVHTIYMTCDENNDATAVATQYGIAKCHSTNECGSVIDGDSLNAHLCNAKQAEACGYALFKVFDYYVGLNRPLKLDF